jgi:hypothetical protein
LTWSVIILFYLFADIIYKYFNVFHIPYILYDTLFGLASNIWHGHKAFLPFCRHNSIKKAFGIYFLTLLFSVVFSFGFTSILWYGQNTFLPLPFLVENLPIEINFLCHMFFILFDIMNNNIPINVKILPKYLKHIFNSNSHYVSLLLNHPKPIL